MRARARSSGTVPAIKAQTLIVVQAFEANDEGEIVPATQPVEMPDERRAVARAKELALRYVGAIAWKRLARPDEGEFGDPEVLFSRGRLPDLDMPVRPEDEVEDLSLVDPPVPRDGDGGGDSEATWMGMQLPAAADWQAFHQAFLEVYLGQEDRDLLAVFTAIENRRIVVLSPEAAKLVLHELPTYSLRACARPPGEMLCLELGHNLQLDTTWFELPAEERQQRHTALATSDAARIEAEAEEFGMLFPELPESPSRRAARDAVERLDIQAITPAGPDALQPAPPVRKPARKRGKQQPNSSGLF